MIIATWNVNSIGVRLPHVLTWLVENKPDVLCIQETKTTDDKFPQAKFHELGYNVEFCGEKSYNGVAIISKAKALSVQKGFVGEPEGASKRLIEVKLESPIAKLPISILNVYIPNGSEVGAEKYFYKLNWLEQLHQYISTRNKVDDLFLVCGDFNIATEDRDVWDAEALAGQILLSPAERESLQKIRDWGLVDTFRLHNQESKQYSWWDYRMGAFRRNMGMRIDHIWVTPELAKHCLSCVIDSAPRRLEKPSDHAPVVAEFAI